MRFPAHLITLMIILTANGRSQELPTPAEMIEMSAGLKRYVHQELVRYASLPEWKKNPIIIFRIYDAGSIAVGESPKSQVFGRSIS